MEAGCTKSARGKTDKCIAYGGGIRCVEPGCKKSAQGNTEKCKAHENTELLEVVKLYYD